jgi:hypothetical protein
MVTKKIDWTAFFHVSIHHTNMLTSINGMIHLSYSFLLCMWREGRSKGNKKVSDSYRSPRFLPLIYSHTHTHKGNKKVSDSYRSPWFLLFIYKNIHTHTHQSLELTAYFHFHAPYSVSVDTMYLKVSKWSLEFS